MRFKTATLFASTLTLFAGNAFAASISVNLSIAQADTNISALPYGIVSSSVWNQGNAASDTNELDDSGAATTLDWQVNGTATNAFNAPAYNDTVFRFGDNADDAGDSVTLSQIPYAEYYIIAYISGRTNLPEASISDGTTTYFFDAPNPESTAFVQITDTGPAGTPVVGNYAVFGSEVAPLTGTSQTLSYARIGAGANPIFGGFQVIEVPEPGSLALMALGGLLVARRRRRG